MGESDNNNLQNPLEVRSTKMTKRSGGRKARIIERKAPLPNNEKPVLPGEIGGTYQPLKQSDMLAIHENILTILETIGFAQATPHCQ